MAEKKSFMEIVLMPLVVAAVGVMGTYFLTQQQQSNALAKADADRQVKILEIFAEKITSPDERERILGLRLLEAVDPDLAAKLAHAVAEGEKEDSKVQQVAYQVARQAEAIARFEPRVFLHHRGEEGLEIANRLREGLEREGIVVPGIEGMGATSPRVSELRFFRKSEEEQAHRIFEILNRDLVQNPIPIEVKYVEGHEESKSVRKMHFELWLAI